MALSLYLEILDKPQRNFYPYTVYSTHRQLKDPSSLDHYSTTSSLFILSFYLSSFHINHLVVLIFSYIHHTPLQILSSFSFFLFLLNLTSSQPCSSATLIHLNLISPQPYPFSTLLHLNPDSLQPYFSVTLIINNHTSP